MRRSLLAVLLFLVALACGGTGCALWSDTPRSRLGGLPFPGTLTLYSTADPEQLGRHRYGRLPRIGRTDEKERGIIYTSRGGFLDLAHVRLTIDRTRYCAARVGRAIKARETSFTLAGPNHSRFHVSLNYPPGWADMDPRARRELAAELSVRTGQRLAYLMMTWHEAITWFGFRSFFLIDESPSAFTWDDTMSHVIGIRVAGRALRDDTREFDDAATVALSDALNRLGAVSPGETDRAARAVEGLWWSNGKPLKRQFNIGLRELVVHPWLVPGLTCFDDDGATEGEPFNLPQMNELLGYDCSNFYAVEIQPRICEADTMRDHLPGRPKRFSHRQDLPVLMKVIRDEMRERFGPDVNAPWPGTKKSDGVQSSSEQTR